MLYELKNTMYADELKIEENIKLFFINQKTWNYLVINTLILQMILEFYLGLYGPTAISRPMI